MFTRKLQCEHFKRAFWLHNNLCDFTALEHKFKRWFCTQKMVLNVRLKITCIQKLFPLVWRIQLISIRGSKFATFTTWFFLPIIIINCIRQTKSESKIYLNLESGYPAETHTIITEDGYILKVHRIPCSK